jgi:hypothetical protein
MVPMFTPLDAAERELRESLVLQNDGTYLLPITPRTVADRMLRRSEEARAEQEVEGQ